MKIGIYNESTSDDSILGGSEVLASVMADILSQHGGDTASVDLIHHRASLEKIQLARLAGVEMKAVQLRYLARQPRQQGYRVKLKKRYDKARSWHQELSQSYDVFVAVVHHTPPFCHARHGLLMVLFPFDKAPTEQFAGRRTRHYLQRPLQLLERAYSGYEWRQRMESYQHHTGISEFTCRWTQRWWSIASQVVYPPVDVEFAERAKSDQILSVGRFSGRGVLKRQPEMMEAFVGMPREELGEWRYLCAGGLGDVPEDKAHFEGVRAQALDAGLQNGQQRAQVVTNIDRAELKRLYETSKIFWHATGWGENEEKTPQQAEHFGISTVEAMAAGCVPIVINKGAQPEIVQHGESGFVWNTPQELESYTLLVAQDDALRARLSRAARARAQVFSRQMFARRVLELLPTLAATSTRSVP